MVNIKLVVGSSRPGRFADIPAEWIKENASKYPNINFEVIDLRDVDLPMLDVETPPMVQPAQSDHAKKWAQIIEESDGFVFLTPEYNHAASPSTINAIDYLFKEWNYKPVAFVSYGADAGGARAVEHLRAAFVQVKAFNLHEQVVIPNYWEYVNETGEFTPTKTHQQKLDQLLEQIIFWSKELMQIRKKLVE